MTQRVIQSARRMAEDLQPLALRGVSLPTALRELAKLLHERHGSVVEVHVDEPLEELSPQESEVLYRAVHEAASNAVQHAEALRVQVSLSAHADLARVEVSDDGVGFDWKESRNHGRLGLRFLFDHAEASVAHCTARSNGGYGIRVVTEGVVVSCTSNLNAAGIYASGGTVMNCTASENVGDGIHVRYGSATNCRASYNGGDGFLATQASVTNCRAGFNGKTGISAVHGSVTSCVAQTNNTSSTAGEFDLHGGNAVVAFCFYETANLTGATLTGNVLE